MLKPSMRHIGRLIFTALILATVPGLKPVFAQNSTPITIDTTSNVPSNIDLDDLPPGTKTTWKRVDVFQKTHFWVPSETLCTEEQKKVDDKKQTKSSKDQIYIANCAYDGIVFNISWGGTDFRPINTNEDAYQTTTEHKNTYVYELESAFEAKYKHFRCLGKIKNEKDLILWAVMESTAETPEDVKLVKNIFLQIKKTNSPSVTVSSQP